MADNPFQKFRGKYRIPSARLAGWDYATPGAYFITICTAGRAHLFGTVRNGQMILSTLGEIVREEWEKSFAIRRELECDAFVIMPNHIHAIVRIVPAVETDGPVNVETDCRPSLRKPQSPPAKTGVAYRAPKSISSFVAGFKSAATKRINEYRGTPGESVWQARFHDHIIRNQQEYERIAAYIAANPINWDQDIYFNKE
ncbi:MAG: transposase [Calditrichaeota bacterium]|nr:MAG: transposase [Calditrichota bacterium]